MPRPKRAGGGTVWLYGRHAVTAALANPARRKHRILVAGEAAPPELAGATAPEKVERADIEQILPPGAVHQNIALETDPLTPVTIADIAAIADQRTHAVVVALDQVSDPRNVGAIMRAAAAFGAIALIMPDRHSPPEGGALAKAAAGALETLPLARVPNLTRALDQMKAAGFWTAGLDAGADQPIENAPLAEKLVLVLGAEGAGLRRLVRENCDLMVRLSMAPEPARGAVESLNVSAAAAIALYEVFRRS